MRPFTTLEAPARSLPLANVDTDQIIPARFMRRPRAEGYGDFLLHDLRFTPEGTPRPEFPLNAAGACEILIADRNFGCGSSREAAVYALADFGIRAVLAPSFGDIFASNAIKNGLLPAQVSEADIESLREAGPEALARGVRIDLAAQTVLVGNRQVSFAIDPVWKKQLLNGWDDLDLTLNEAGAIAAFQTADARARPWMQPADKG